MCCWWSTGSADVVADVFHTKFSSLGLLGIQHYCPLSPYSWTAADTTGNRKPPLLLGGGDGNLRRVWSISRLDLLRTRIRNPCVSATISVIKESISMPYTLPYKAFLMSKVPCSEVAGLLLFSHDMFCLYGKKEIPTNDEYIKTAKAK